MSKRNQIIIIRRRIMLLFSLATVITFLLGFKMVSSANESVNYDLCYTSVYVNPGDTLWTIAESYVTTYENNKEDFVKEVMRLNHIAEAKDLKSGNYIVVPYYTTSDSLLN